MKKMLLGLLAVTFIGFSATIKFFEQARISKIIDKVLVSINQEPFNAQSLVEIVLMLKEQKSLNSALVDKVLTTLVCSKMHHVDHNNILTIIDYSLPSSEKRLWIFDLKAKKLLFYTYVSHGITSGSLRSEYFSNKYNSRASSIGVFKTEQAYYGREGLSLKLEGLDRGFNDNAFNRYIVMHGGWYVNEPFIKK